MVLTLELEMDHPRLVIVVVRNPDLTMDALSFAALLPPKIRATVSGGASAEVEKDLSTPGFTSSLSSNFEEIPERRR